MANKKKEVQLSLLDAAMATQKMVSRLKVYSHSGNVSTTDSKKIAEWIYRLEYIENQIIADHLENLENQFHKENRLVDNAHIFIQKLSEANNLAKHNCESERLMSVLDSICPIWPFC